jgi:hypothetical protein
MYSGKLWYIVGEPAPLTELTQAPTPTAGDNDENTDLREGSSAKIDQLMHLLRLTPEDEKSLVFSQFTTFLDKVCPLFPALSDCLRRSVSERLQRSLIKKGQYIFAACDFFTCSQHISIGYRTPNLMAGCLQSSGKKCWRCYVFRLNMTRGRPQMSTLSQRQGMFALREINRMEHVTCSYWTAQH